MVHGRAEDGGLAAAKGSQQRHDSEGRGGREAQPVGRDPSG